MSFSEERAAGRFGPVHLLVAENPYVLWDAAEHWKATWRAGGDCSLSIQYGRQLDPDRLAQLIDSLPMFATLQLVIIHDVDKIPLLRQQAVLDALRRQSDGVKALLTGAKLDRRLTFTKELVRLVPTEEFPSIYDNHLPGWAKRIASDLGTSLSPAAAEHLALLHGTDLFEMRQTIERALLYSGAGQRRLSEQEITAVVAGDGEHTVFELADAVGSDDLTRALQTLQSLYTQGDVSVYVTAALFGHYQRVLLLTPFGAGVADAQIAQSTGLRPFIIRKLRPQAVRIDAERAADALEAICETDWSIKTSTIPGRTAVELLMYRLCRGTRTASPLWFDVPATTRRG
ncbi:MAG TPA: DNA polymerase III subunit delta [candidate division Zixibacteria bacterium]|jgi:DNA polymerase III delta subunit